MLKSRVFGVSSEEAAGPEELMLSLRMTSPHPLLCHPLVSVSNGASHIEEDEDEDEGEQGEKFEFDDGDDIGPTEMSSDSLMKSDWTTETAVSNLYAKTNTAQETVRQGMNGPFSTGQKSPNVSLCQSHCSGMEIRESPEGRSTSSDLGVTGESESFWKASSIYEVIHTDPHRSTSASVPPEKMSSKGKPSLIGEDDQDMSSSAVNGCSPQQDTVEAEVSSSVSPQTNSTGSCSPASVVRDTEVIYDDVPAESIQHPVEDVDDIYEDIQRPDNRGSNGWSSSEFESYDELSDSDTVPPADSSSKLPADVLRLKERCAVTRKEFAVRLSAPHVANIRQSCDTKVGLCPLPLYKDAP
ncbi:rho guanine nucleotide exchange factor 10-like protein isoform X2 [Epinephelus moara]|uniref:rho guanine nucleotide exchange factor 10-like protein isoform X2 n=2 Tax=Epinephelus moara TaxID=300413 RepID=UPI00214F4588|nr:rho guanine nucleotide exchange factor 10-like protein isoform X2 [Epinephelus moara]